MQECSGERRALLFVHMPLFRSSDHFCGGGGVDTCRFPQATQGAGEEEVEAGGSRLLLPEPRLGVEANVPYSPAFCVGDSGGVTYKVRDLRACIRVCLRVLSALAVHALRAADGREPWRRASKSAMFP